MDNLRTYLLTAHMVNILGTKHGIDSQATVLKTTKGPLRYPGMLGALVHKCEK